jgi:hypothetical protein
MCPNLDFQFLPFYCLFMFVFSFLLFALCRLFIFQVFYCLFPLLLLGFYCPSFFSSPFLLCFCLCFSAPMIFILAYPNLLGTKRLDCCCCCCGRAIYFPNDFNLLFYKKNKVARNSSLNHLRLGLRNASTTSRLE